MSLTVKGLSKKYGDKTALTDLSFSMEKPGVYAILGTNGAGKTTALRMMLGMLSRDSGEVLWNNSPLDTRTCNVGYLAEERGLYPKYPILDQLLYFASLKGVSKAAALEKIKSLAARLEVEEYIFPQTVYTSSGKMAKKVKPKKPDQLSKGNQQKIQFMITLISDPELIILDEPMSGLDPVNTDLFRSMIREEIDKGKYIIMSSHQMPTVEEFCSDIVILDKSRVVLQGNLNEIKKSYGRIRLSLKAERDISDIIKEENILCLSRKENEYELKVSGEKQANDLLFRLISEKVTVIKFDLREPSLHEIFVSKVGAEQ